MSTDNLIERLRGGTMRFDWSDIPDDALIPAVPLLREAAAALAATLEENQGLRSALNERDVLLESAEKQIVSLYRAAAPGGNYDNELTINGHVSGNNFADSDEVVIAIRGSRRANPDHGAAG